MSHLIKTVALTFASGVAFIQPVGSQDILRPDRPITMVHPFAPGGVGYDLAHVIGEYLKRQHDMTVVVEPRPGGNTVVGALSVTRSEPDGSFLLINAVSMLSMAGAIYKNPPYDPAADLLPVAFVAKFPLILVVNPGLPVQSLEDMANLAQSTPGGLSFASAGTGGAQHLSAELLKRSLKIDITHVPFGGPVPALTAVAGGHVALMFSDILNALPLIEAGKLRPIGVTTSKRSEVLPDVPTFAEMGMAGFDYDLQIGIFASAKTPPEAIANLNARIRAAMSDNSLRTKFAKQGIQVIDTPPPEKLQDIYHQDLARWSKLIEEAGLARSQ